MLRISNSRADRARPDDLRRLVDQIESERPGAAKRLVRLKEIYAQISQQSRAFQTGRIRELEERAMDLKAQLAAAGAAEFEAASTLERTRALAETGIQTRVALERAERDAKVATETQKSLNHRLFSGEVELEAARRGEYVGDTYNDRPSSLQLADELSIRIAEAEAELTSRDQRLAKLRAELDAEAAHYSELSTAVLTSPIDAQVWEVLVSPGEEVRKVQDLLRLPDCSGAVVTVTVRESVFNQLRIGEGAIPFLEPVGRARRNHCPHVGGRCASGQSCNSTIRALVRRISNRRVSPRPRGDTVRSRPHRNGRIQCFGWIRGDVATASRRNFLFPARFLTLMSGGWSEPIAPALVAVGLLCLFLPWADRENRWVRAALVAVSLILTWYYLLWRTTQTLPQFGLSADWLCGIIFLGAEVLTGIGATITWFMLTRSCSRSAAVAANTPWLVQNAAPRRRPNLHLQRRPSHP